MRVAIESTSEQHGYKDYYEDYKDNFHNEMVQPGTNYEIDNQLRISFMTDKPNVKSWAEIEAEYKHDSKRMDTC